MNQSKLSFTILSLGIILSIFWSLSFSLRELQQHFFLSQINHNLKQYFSDLPSWHNNSLAAKTEILESKNLLQNSRLSSKEAYELGKLEFLFSASEKEIEKKLQYLCSAKSLFNQALSISPKNLEYNLSLADTESLSALLPNTCLDDASQTTSINARERLKLVSYLGPQEDFLHYKSALIYRTMNDNLNAMRSFRKYEETTPGNRDDIREFEVSLVNSPEELKEALPRRYPSILLWIREYTKQKGEPRDAYLESFRIALNETVDNIINEAKIGKIKEEFLESSLSSIFNETIVRESEELRSKIGRLLSEYYLLRNNHYSKKLMDEISNRRRLEFLTSKNFSTKSKLSGSTFNWSHNSSDKAISIDLRSEGIGFFINSDQNLNLIILRGSNSSSLPKDLTAEIWTSENNETYTLTRENIKTDTGLFDDRHTLMLHTGEIKAPYIKIFFKYNGDFINPSMSGPIKTLVEAYN